MQPVTFVDASKKVKMSLVTISSPIKDKTHIFTNPLILQAENQSQVKSKEVLENVIPSDREEIESLKEKNA